jgi:CRP-like cAMP-binding protein
MSRSRGVPAQNDLLAALPAAGRRQLLAQCEQVQLTLGKVLFEQGERVRHVYFPITGFVSLVTTTSADPPLEVGLVGVEGMLGISLLLGVDLAPLRGLVQGSGSAWRLDAAAFLRALKRDPALRRHLNRYLYVRLALLAQAAVCTRFHVVESRLARWLLMTRDRAHADSFPITQEFLAYMLGVRRVGVTRAAGALQRDKLIHYSRGKLQIIDGRGLQAAACACYAADLKAYRRVMA